MIIMYINRYTMLYKHGKRTVFQQLSSRKPVSFEEQMHFLL